MILLKQLAVNLPEDQAYLCVQTKTNPKGCAALIVVGALEVDHKLILTT
jgi:hypothetical protein